jgi:hypothetical protein
MGEVAPRVLVRGNRVEPRVPEEALLTPSREAVVGSSREIAKAATRKAAQIQPGEGKARVLVGEIETKTRVPAKGKGPEKTIMGQAQGTFQTSP